MPDPAPLIDDAATQSLKQLKRIIASRGRLIGNFYFAGDTRGGTAGLAVTLTGRDPKGAKVTVQGKKLRAAIDGAKFARGTVRLDGAKLRFFLHSGNATKDHMKRGFKRSFDSDTAAPLKVILRKALFGELDGADEELEEGAQLDVDALFSELSVKERAELTELIQQQGDLDTCSGALMTSFLSAEAAEADLKEHTQALSRKVRWHAEQDPVDAEALAAARRSLAEALHTGEAPFVAVGEPLPEESVLLLDTALSLFERSKKPREPRDRSTIPEGGGTWGKRSQIGATMKALLDAQGNQDGVWDNEDDLPGSTGSLLDRNPLLSKIRQLFSTGLSTRDEVKALNEFRKHCESEWDQPVTDLDITRLKNGKLFATQKAIALARMGRHPRDVTEDFVLAKGTVAGVEIEPREVFTQRFKPTAPPTGNVVVISPGFQETGRHFYEQIQALNAQGHDVVVMDHQWAGQSDGEPGGLDRGFGVARDVAAVAAYAARLQKEEYGDIAGSRVALFGNSMGGGPGVLGALALNDKGLIELEGDPMPEGLDAVLQSPFLGATDNITNKLLAIGSKVPGLSDLALPSTGFPVLTTDETASQKDSQVSVLEDIRAQLSSMTGANEDLEFILGLVEKGDAPSGKLSMVHGDGDPLADPEKSRELAESTDSPLEMLHTDDHVLEHSPKRQGVAVRAMGELLGVVDSSEGKDVTDRFHDLIERVKSGKHTLPDDAKDYIYLNIPGLFTERYPGYMDDNFARMDELGLQSSMIEVDTDAGVEQNAEDIRDAILDAVGDSGRKVVLTGHSKGGVDLSVALSLYPELSEHVHAVITMQAPFSGTPIGDLVKDNEVLRDAVSLLVEGGWEGDIASLTDLSSSSREAFIAEHPYPDVPTVSLATSTRSMLAGMGIPAAILKHLAGDSDGAVPMDSALLPGSDCIKLEDMDHAGPVLPNPLGFCGSQKAGDLTEVLITLALEKASR